MPRKMRTGSMWPLGCFEERRELLQRRRAERLERRHRRAGVDAGRALEVTDLEVDAEVLRADVRQIRGAEVGGAGTEIGVTGGAAGDREQLRAGHGLRIVAEALLL